MLMAFFPASFKPHFKYGQRLFKYSLAVFQSSCWSRKSCCSICSKRAVFLFQPPSKNRRERSELKPDYFDPASIMDESVRIIYTHLDLFHLVHRRTLG